MSFLIVTDSCSDFSPEKIRELNISVVPLSVTFRNQTFSDKNDDSLKEMYNGFRSGEPATTSAVNPDGWAEILRTGCEQGQDMLVLAFSSGLSATYQSAVIAANEVQESYPERKIVVVDTLAASLGQGLLVWYACKKRAEGCTLEETAAWIEENKLRLCHWFTVDDLMYLKRGGRINAATALVGTMLGVKPILHVDDAGKLISVGKARGRKASLQALADKFGALGADPAQTVFISHGDCRADADYLAELLKSQYGIGEVFTNYVGAVIGSHAGPGTVALFFLGDHR